FFLEVHYQVIESQRLCNLVLPHIARDIGVFFFTATATPDIYTLSLHDALPILLQRIFLMSSLMLLLVWLIFFMVLIKLLPILGTISGKTVKLMVLALICLGNNRQD